MSSNTRNSLRVEKKRIGFKIFFLDWNRIISLKGELSDVIFKIHRETQQLSKLKSANLNITSSPLLNNTFRTPPKSVASVSKNSV